MNAREEINKKLKKIVNSNDKKIQNIVENEPVNGLRYESKKELLKEENAILDNFVSINAELQNKNKQFSNLKLSVNKLLDELELLTNFKKIDSELITYAIRKSEIKDKLQ